MIDYNINDYGECYPRGVLFLSSTAPKINSMGHGTGGGNKYGGWIDCSLVNTQHENLYIADYGESERTGHDLGTGNEFLILDSSIY